MERINEFEEKISDNELAGYALRVRKLTDEQIDELWNLCSFIISGCEEKFKSIRQTDINDIRTSLDSSKEKIFSLIAETPIQEFKTNLSKVEIR